MSGTDQYCGKYNCYIKHGYFSFLPQVNAGHNIKCIDCIFIFHVGCDLKQELHMVKAKVYTEFITKKETHFSMILTHSGSFVFLQELQSYLIAF